MIKLVKNECFIYCKDTRIESNRSFYGSFILGPFEPDQSITVANALRRTLLAEIKSLAITSVEIEGVFHEYSTLPGVRDSILDILLNLKDIVLKSSNYINQKTCGGEKKSVFKNLQVGYLKMKGPGIITSTHLKLPPGIQCVDQDQYIATLSEEGSINMKFYISYGSSQNWDHHKNEAFRENFKSQMEIEKEHVPFESSNLKASSFSNARKNNNLLKSEAFKQGELQLNGTHLIVSKKQLSLISIFGVPPSKLKTASLQQLLKASRSYFFCFFSGATKKKPQLRKLLKSPTLNSSFFNVANNKRAALLFLSPKKRREKNKKFLHLMNRLNEFLIWRTNHSSYFNNTSKTFWFKKMKQIQTKLLNYGVAIDYFYNPSLKNKKEDLLLALASNSTKKSSVAKSNSFGKKSNMFPKIVGDKNKQNNPISTNLTLLSPFNILIPWLAFFGGPKNKGKFANFSSKPSVFFLYQKKKRNKKQIDWAGTRETKAKIKQLNEDFKNKKIKKIWTNYQEKSKFETLASTLKIDSIFMPVTKVNYLIELNDSSVLTKDSVVEKKNPLYFKDKQSLNKIKLSTQISQFHVSRAKNNEQNTVNKSFAFKEQKLNYLKAFITISLKTLSFFSYTDKKKRGTGKSLISQKASNLSLSKLHAIKNMNTNLVGSTPNILSFNKMKNKETLVISEGGSVYNLRDALNKKKGGQTFSTKYKKLGILKSLLIRTYNISFQTNFPKTFQYVEPKIHHKLFSIVKSKSNNMLSQPISWIATPYGSSFFGYPSFYKNKKEKSTLTLKPAYLKINSLLKKQINHLNQYFKYHKRKKKKRLAKFSNFIGLELQKNQSIRQASKSPLSKTILGNKSLLLLSNYFFKGLAFTIGKGVLTYNLLFNLIKNVFKKSFNKNFLQQNLILNLDIKKIRKKVNSNLFIKQSLISQVDNHVFDFNKIKKKTLLRKFPTSVGIVKEENVRSNNRSNSQFDSLDKNFSLILKNDKVKMVSLKNNIILEIWTNGSIHPREALYEACKNLLNIFSKLEKGKFLRALAERENTYDKINNSLLQMDLSAPFISKAYKHVVLGEIVKDHQLFQNTNQISVAKAKHRPLISKAYKIKAKLLNLTNPSFLVQKTIATTSKKRRNLEINIKSQFLTSISKAYTNRVGHVSINSCPDNYLAPFIFSRQNLKSNSKMNSFLTLLPTIDLNASFLRSSIFSKNASNFFGSSQKKDLLKSKTFRDSFFLSFLTSFFITNSYFSELKKNFIFSSQPALNFSDQELKKNIDPKIVQQFLKAKLLDKRSLKNNLVHLYNVIFVILQKKTVINMVKLLNYSIIKLLRNNYLKTVFFRNLSRNLLIEIIYLNKFLLKKRNSNLLTFSCVFSGYPLFIKKKKKEDKKNIVTPSKFPSTSRLSFFGQKKKNKV